MPRADALRFASIAFAMTFFTAACGALKEPCSVTPKSCYGEALREARGAEIDAADARERSDRAAQLFGLACEGGDTGSCREVARFWLARQSTARTDRAAKVDRLTLLTVDSPSDDAPATSQAHFARYWRLLEESEYRDAQSAGTVTAWETFLREHPHAPQAAAARDALVGSEVATLLDEARRTGRVDHLLAYVEAHRSHRAAASALVEVGVEGRSRDELARMADLLAVNEDDDLQRHSDRYREAEASLTLSEALGLRDEGSVVAALRSFLDRYRSSRRRGEATTELARRWGELAPASGSVESMSQFLEQYPADSHAPAVQRSLAKLLLRPEVKAPVQVYKTLIASAPKLPEIWALRRRLFETEQRAVAEDAKKRARASCIENCNVDAVARCSRETDDATDSSPRRLCMSGRLRKCCASCGTSIDTSSYDRCR